MTSELTFADPLADSARGLLRCYFSERQPLPIYIIDVDQLPDFLCTPDGICIHVQ